MVRTSDAETLADAYEEIDRVSTTLSQALAPRIGADRVVNKKPQEQTDAEWWADYDRGSSQTDLIGAVTDDERLVEDVEVADLVPVGLDLIEGFPDVGIFVGGIL